MLVNLEGKQKSFLRLLKSCENAKKILSLQDKVNIELNNLMGGKDLNLVITRRNLKIYALIHLKNV